MENVVTFHPKRPKVRPKSAINTPKEMMSIPRHFYVGVPPPQGAGWPLSSYTHPIPFTLQLCYLCNNNYFGPSITGSLIEGNSLIEVQLYLLALAPLIAHNNTTGFI